MGCHFLLQCIQVYSESEVAPSCQALTDLMECSLPGSSAPGSFQARVSLIPYLTRCPEPGCVLPLVKPPTTTSEPPSLPCTESTSSCPCEIPQHIFLSPHLGPCTDIGWISPLFNPPDKHSWPLLSVPALNQSRSCPFKSPPAPTPEPTARSLRSTSLGLALGRAPNAYS